MTHPNESLSPLNGDAGVAQVGELLPCPFCGSPAETTEQASGILRVTCSNWKSCGMFPQIKTKTKDAIAAWNRRAANTTGTVKGLQWEKSRNGDYHADTAVGQYSVGVVAGYVIAVLRCVLRGDADDVNVGRGRFDTHDEAKAACEADFAQRILSSLEPASSVEGEEPATHADDLAVDRFAAVMKAKLAKKRAEGRGGWEDKEACTAVFLSSLLHGHVIKGDPVDVANLAMMLHQRGETILQTPNSGEHYPRGSTFVFSSRTRPSPAVSAEVTGKDLMHALLTLPHSITGSEVVIRGSQQRTGNTLSQIHAVLDEALLAFRKEGE